MSEKDSIATRANRLAGTREAAEMSQAELAGLAGVSRAAISSMENGMASPSVHAALAVARALGLSVEEIFGEGESKQDMARWAWEPRAGDAPYWTVRGSDGIRHYPVEALDMNPVPPDGIRRSGKFFPAAAEAPHTLTVASCDPAMNVLAGEFSRTCGARLLVFPRNATEALSLLGRGAVQLATLHAATPEEPGENLRRVRAILGAGWVLVRLADWVSGIALTPSDRTRSSSAVVRGKRRWALRERGSVARESLDALLGKRQPQGRVVRGHREVASAIQAGWADAGICLQLCALEAGLNFLPQRTESLDLVFHESALPDIRVRKLIGLLESSPWRQFLSTLPGYDSRQTGETRMT